MNIQGFEKNHGLETHHPAQPKRKTWAMGVALPRDKNGTLTLQSPQTSANFNWRRNSERLVRDTESHSLLMKGGFAFNVAEN